MKTPPTIRLRSWIPTRRGVGVGLAIVLLVFATPASSAAEGDSDGSPLYNYFNEQLLLIATVIGAVATLPTLIEFLIERRKRRERIALSIDDVEACTLSPRVAGMDNLLQSIADLVDRVRNPRAYAGLGVGNEVLIIGPRLSGKKMLAQRMARDAAIDRLITVYNPRNPDALAKAKSLVQRYRRQKIMLLLPGLDEVFEQADDEALSELEALIETTSELDNVLVVGTAAWLEPDSDLDNLFGIKLMIPGTVREDAPPRELTAEAHRVLSDVARFYLDRATAAGFRLDSASHNQFCQRILQVANNPAEIEDIVTVCQTTALHRRRIGAAPELSITPAILETAIGRVITSAVPKGA